MFFNFDKTTIFSVFIFIYIYQEMSSKFIAGMCTGIFVGVEYYDNMKPIVNLVKNEIKNLEHKIKSIEIQTNTEIKTNIQTNITK